MTHRRQARFAAAAAVMAAAAGLAGAGAAGAATPTATAAAAATAACRAWTGSHPPFAVEVTSVVTLSPCDIWAAGANGDTGAPASLISLLHWNGRAWTRITTPVAPSVTYGAPSVAATSSRDVWVADEQTDASVVPQQVQTYIAHWGGTGLARAASPNPSAPPWDNLLNGISATSPGDAWAVGGYTAANQTTPLAVHWDGRAWTQVPVPLPRSASGQPSPFAPLYAVTALCGCYAWAVGLYDVPVTSGFRLLSLIEHWNGRAWTQVPSPSPEGDNWLLSVSASSRRDAWAVGYHTYRSYTLTLTEHWNGRAWIVVPSPSPGRYYTHPNGMLHGVAAISPRDAWAVGTYENGPEPPRGTPPGGAVLLHWTGKAWRQVPFPHVGAPGAIDVPLAVSASSAGNVIVAGYYTNPGSTVFQALIVRVR